MKRLLSIALVLGLLAPSWEAEATCRPNVLLIITDDQNDYALAAGGMPVQTPYLDKLEKQAINFAKAYCASPVCGPSRASLFSGLYPHKTGAYLNGADPWNRSEQLRAAETLPELFRRGGYHSWGMGKLYHAKLPESRKQQWDNKAAANGGFGPFVDQEHQFAGKFFSLRSGPWRYIRYPDGAEELYDHREDPHEFDNLEPDAKTRETLIKFRDFVPSHWTPSLGGRNG